MVEQFRLLGVEVRSDMRWISNTNSICLKFYARLWILRNLKRLGTSITELVDVYIKQCRVMAELAVPVWQPALTKAESHQSERCQVAALAIVLGSNYRNYKSAMEVLGLTTLQDRRLEICKKKSVKIREE